MNYPDGMYLSDIDALDSSNEIHDRAWSIVKRLPAEKRTYEAMQEMTRRIAKRDHEAVYGRRRFYV